MNKDENKDLNYEKLEKKIKVLEERLNNYSFLINLSQVLKIDKTIVKEVETYRAKSMLYDRLQSGTQNEILILKTDYNSLLAKTRFLDSLMKLVELWKTQLKASDIKLIQDMELMIKAYNELRGMR